MLELYPEPTAYQIVVSNLATFGAFSSFFWPFEAIFWIEVRFKTNNFNFGSMALSCFFATFSWGGGEVGGVAGHCDFNEIHVVSF